MNLKSFLTLIHRWRIDLLFLIPANEIVILVWLESSWKRRKQVSNNLTKTINHLPHCLIQDLAWYSFDLFEAKKRKIYNGNLLKFIDHQERQQKEQQVLWKQSISVHWVQCSAKEKNLLVQFAWIRWWVLLHLFFDFSLPLSHLLCLPQIKT